MLGTWPLSETVATVAPLLQCHWWCWSSRNPQRWNPALRSSWYKSDTWDFKPTCCLLPGSNLVRSAGCPPKIWSGRLRIAHLGWLHPTLNSIQRGYKLMFFAAGLPGLHLVMPKEGGSERCELISSGSWRSFLLHLHLPVLNVCSWEKPRKEQEWGSIRRGVVEVTSEVMGSGHPCHHVPTESSPCINLLFKSIPNL